MLALRNARHIALTSRITVISRTFSSPRSQSPIEKLHASFSDPSSPYYLPQGTEGPSSPGSGFVNPDHAYPLADAFGPRKDIPSELNAHSGASGSMSSASDEGRTKLISIGFDPHSLYEQKVVWGDLDPFRHVNNVRYLRFLESARMFWLQSIGHELGGPERIRDMLAGKGISLILGEISVKFRRPVIYPDTLLIAHMPHDIRQKRFKCAAAIWSNAQREIVTTSDSTLVWYDYDNLKKCDPGETAHEILRKRVHESYAESLALNADGA